MLGILLAALVTALAIFHWKRRKFYALAAQLPTPSGQLPIFGIAHKFIGVDTEDYGDILLKSVDHNEPIQSIWFGTKLVLVVNSPELFRTVFTSPACLHKPELMYDGFFGGKGLLTNNGAMQDHHRKILNHSMTPSILQQLNPVFNEKIAQFVTRMSGKAGGPEFNVFDDIAACALSALMKGNFRFEDDWYGSDLLAAFNSLTVQMTSRIAQPWLALKPLFAVSSLAREVEQLKRPIAHKIDEILTENDELRLESELKQGVFISQLLNQRSNFSEEEIRDEIYTLIFGGYETTAVTLSTCLLMLAMHMDVQQRVIDEIDGSTFAAGSPLTVEDTQGFPFIERVLKETMRLFPVAPLIMRQTTAEVDFEGRRVPDGTLIAIPIYLLHRKADVWGDDAAEFRPDRFEAKDIHPFAFAPFSGGKRMCLGYKYAMIFMKIFVVSFFKEFTVDTSLRLEELRVKIAPTLHVKQGYRVSVKRRESLA